MIAEQKLTFPALFDVSLKNHGQANFLSFVDGEPMTYKQVGEEIDKLKSLLAKNGIERGDRVALLSANMPNWGISYFAITFMGAVVVPMLPDFHETEIENILKHSGAKGIIVSDRLKSKIEHLDCKGIQLGK
jgi:long-chain acyl-CoA synthetase